MRFGVLCRLVWPRHLVFIHLFIQQTLRSTYYTPNTVVDARDSAVTKTRKTFSPGAVIPVGRPAARLFWAGWRRRPWGREWRVEATEMASGLSSCLHSLPE